MTPTPIPVRKIHDDGYITVRYVNPDGTEFEDELPEHLTLGADPHPITAVWEYGLGHPGRVMTQETMPNLLHLSEVDPLLFEEFLNTMEKSSWDEQMLWGDRLMTKIMHPTAHRPNESFAPVFRSMLRTIPVVAQLGPYTVSANTLISNARKTLKYLGHQHLAATAFCYWVTDDGSTLYPRISYTKYQKDIEFIDDNLEAVMSIRDALKRVKSFDRKFVAEMLGSSSALTDGTL